MRETEYSANGCLVEEDGEQRLLLIVSKERTPRNRPYAISQSNRSAPFSACPCRQTSQSSFSGWSRSFKYFRSGAGVVLAHARLLEQVGPQLGRPTVSTLKGSRHANMKELRFDAADGVWRVAFALDPKRKVSFLSRVTSQAGVKAFLCS